MPSLPAKGRAIELLRRADLIDEARAARDVALRTSADVQARVAGVRGDRRYADLLAAHPDLRLSHDGILPVVSRAQGRRRAIDLMAANRDLAVDLLTALAVPYTVMATDSVRRYRLAVPDTARALLVAEAAAHAPVSAYVGFDRGDRGATARVTRLREGVPAGPAQRADVWRIFEYVEDPVGRPIGPEHGCDIEFWQPAEHGDLAATQWNPAVDVVPRRLFGAAAQQVKDRVLRVTPGTVDGPMVGDVAFPVDLVYTWVDGDDPVWLARRAERFGQIDLARRNREAANRARFRSHDELRYSLRSVEQFADFVNHVYVVTDAQRPDWLVADHPGLTVVDHRDIFDHRCLPTYNSHAIEARLHHIDGLSEHYLYLNDDFFFGRRITASRFFHTNGLAKFFMSRAHIPLGSADVGTLPVNAAAMNVRDLVQREFGVRPTRKLKHAPYPQVKGVLREIDERFGEDVARTADSTVRAPSDIAVASSLHHYVAYATGRAVPAGIRSHYVDLGSPDAPASLAQLLRRRSHDVFCLNDAESEIRTPAQQAQMVRAFLDRYFPVPSSFER